MFTGMELMACHSLAVPAEIMQHVIHVESGNNPYAIGVVGGQLVRQPQTLPEAVATVHMLEAKGYNYSLGVAQVNRNNLGKYGLDTYEQAFDPCPNAAAGSRILAACYATSGKEWGKAFSCYYSGNFVTGYRDGYVQKIYDSIHRSSVLATADVTPIPLQGESSQPFKNNRTMLTTTATHAAYRVALRSEIIDSAAALVVSKAASAFTGKPGGAMQASPMLSDQVAASADPVEADATPALPSDIFVPKVRGPNDPAMQATTVAQASADRLNAQQLAVTDHADLREGKDDAAFVF